MNKKNNKTHKKWCKNYNHIWYLKNTPYNLPGRSIHENPTPPFSVRTNVICLVFQYLCSNLEVSMKLKTAKAIFYGVTSNK